MGRKRTDPNSKGLPPRWRFTRNAYYYQVPPGMESFWDGKKTFRLGKTLAEASAEWARRVESPSQVKTVSDLLNRYQKEIIPTKSPKTISLYDGYIKNLRAVLGHFLVDQIEAQHVYQYVEKRRIKKTDESGVMRGGLSIAKREVTMLSNVYTKAVKWGYIKIHPFKRQLELDGERPRNRYIHDWELEEFFSLKPINRVDSTLVIQAYTAVKLITGLRTQDLLTLKVSQFTEEGITVTPLKTKSRTGKTITIEWTPALRQAIKYALEVRLVDISSYVFCKRNGEAYYNIEKKDPASGWKSCFRRYMARTIRETKLEERFTDHDLRAKCASDMNSDESAMKLLAHANIETTKRIYRRAPVKVTPAK